MFYGMVKQVAQLGRSERGGEAYSTCTSSR